MKRADLHQGEYISGRRILDYWTRCENCAQLAECKKRRAPVADCDTPGWMRFRFDEHDKGVFWSGVIGLSKIASVVREYLECEEDALPLDAYVPMRQMRLEEAL